jgi:hypothetical protein
MPWQKIVTAPFDSMQVVAAQSTLGFTQAQVGWSAQAAGNGRQTLSGRCRTAAPPEPPLPLAPAWPGAPAPPSGIQQ